MRKLSIFVVIVMMFTMFSFNVVFASTETPSDGSTLNDLATIGKTYTENFADNGAALGMFSYDPTHFSIVSDSSAIAGNSLKLNYTSATNGSVYSFSLKNKLTAAGEYEIKVDYKVLTSQMPTNFYMGFTRDGGANQKNTELNFTGDVANTVYTFTGVFNLDNFNDYYMYWFNLSPTDGSQIVIDTLRVERLTAETPSDGSTLNNLATIGSPYTTNFADNGTAIGIWSNDQTHYSFINDDRAIAGNSVMQDFTKQTNTNGCLRALNMAGKLVGGAYYRVTVNYKVLTTTMPTAYYFGFNGNGATQVNYQLDFRNKSPNIIYTYTQDFQLGNFSTYYLQWFDSNCKDGSQIVFDNLTLVRIDPTTDGASVFSLANIGQPYTENFNNQDAGLALFSSATPPSLVYSFVNDSTAISGTSLKLNFSNTTSGCVYATRMKGYLTANAYYRVTLNYKVLTTTKPTAFYFGFTRDGSANQINSQLDLRNNSPNKVYTYTQDFQLQNYSDYYLQFFNLSTTDGSVMVIDNIQVVRIDPTTDSATVFNLSTLGKTYTENFNNQDGGLALYSDDANHYSFVNDSTAINGTSLELNYTNTTIGDMYAMRTKGYLLAGGNYRITANYKILTDQVPTGFYFGFTRDGSLNQKNVQVNFAGSQKNTVYTYTHDFTLGNFSDYYLQWFNVNGKDGSILVLDNIQLQLIPVDLGSFNISANNTMTNLQPGTSITALSGSINPLGGASVAVSNSLSSDGNVGTGTTVDVTVNGTDTQYTALLYGDINGDGLVDLSDLVSMRNYILGNQSLSGSLKTAGNFYGESDISLNDLVGLMANISGIGTISQN